MPPGALDIERTRVRFRGHPRCLFLVDETGLPDLTVHRSGRETDEQLYHDTWGRICAEERTLRAQVFATKVPRSPQPAAAGK